MKKKDMIRIFNNAIEDKVPYIAVKQTNSILKKQFISIIPKENFECFIEGLDSYTEDLEFNSNLISVKIKFVDACIMKELPTEVKLFLKI